MSLNWLRSALVYHQRKKNCRTGLHRVRSGHLFLVCCTHNLANWQQMDLWMDEQNTKRGNIFFLKSSNPPATFQWEKNPKHTQNPLKHFVDFSHLLPCNFIYNFLDCFTNHSVVYNVWKMKTHKSLPKSIKHSQYLFIPIYTLFMRKLIQTLASTIAQ